MDFSCVIHLSHSIVTQQSSHINGLQGIWFYFPIQNSAMQPVIATDLEHPIIAVTQLLTKTPVFWSSSNLI